MEAAEAVCDAEGDLGLDVLEGVESLVDKSLMRQEEVFEAELRFAMLETIREYAREKLEQSGEAKELKRAHAEYFLALAEEAERELRGPAQAKWLEHLEAEHDNLRAALSWSFDGENAELGLQLAGALWWFWFVRGYFSEGRRWLEEALAKSGAAASASYRARALTGAGRLVLEQGDTEQAKELLQESVALFRRLEDKGGLAHSVDTLGIMALYHGELEWAGSLLEESVALSREAGNRWGLAKSLNNLGIVAASQDDKDRAIALYEESLRIRRELGDKRGLAMSLSNLTNYAQLDGELERAEVMLEEVLSLGRELGDKSFIVNALGGHGMVALERGDPERSAALLKESLWMCREMGYVVGILSCLAGLAMAAAVTGTTERAARLWGAAEGLCEATGISLNSVLETRHYERYQAAARAELGEEAWEETLAEGRAMTTEEAISYALKEEVAGG
jgi:tetratricopeptide (TPR) repeat protein